MATTTSNPNLTALLPGQNPTGNPITIPFGTSAAPAGQNPMLPSGPSSTSSSSPVVNPYNPQGTTSTFSLPFAADSGPYASTSLLAPPGSTGTSAPPPNTGSSGSGATGVNPIGAGLGMPTTGKGENKTLQSLNKTFGAGLGTAIYNFLAGGAGFNQAAVNNLIAALQPGYQQDQQNLMTEFSAGGNRFSSGAQIGLSNLESNEQLNTGQLETQMYEQSVNDFIGVLMGSAQLSANRKAQPSFLDQLMSGLPGMATAAATAYTGYENNN
jgi:hypothetical protein